MTPLVSIVIPTAYRPNYLPRAVASALAGLQPGDVEVIVVPNGPDYSWKESLLPYQNNPSVLVAPIPDANANIARNVGLSQARGAFVRFLDDDDYLIPDEAAQQYHLISKLGVDVVCGSINVVNPDGKVVHTLKPPDYQDFCQAVTSPMGLYLPNAYVFRQNTISGMAWNPLIKNRQDFYWLLDICKAKEITWNRMPEIVGVWQHHWGMRTTTKDNIDISSRLIAHALFRLFCALQRDNRLTGGRRRSIAQALWHCVHTAFVFAPGYWTEVAEGARLIDPTSRPFIQIYNWPIARKLDPLLMQWLLLPIRRFRYLKRNWNLKRKAETFWGHG